MQRSGTPRHKARDFKANLVLIALPLVVVWGIFCYLTINNALSISRNSEFLYSENLPYIRSSFQADYALSNISYKVEIMSRTTNKDLLRDYYIRALEIINDPELANNSTFAQEYDLLTKNLSLLYDLKKKLVEQNEQIGLAWLRLFYSIDTIFVLNGDLKASQNVLLKDMPAIFSNFQVFLPAVSKSRDSHRQELHKQCMSVFEKSAATLGRKFIPSDNISESMPRISVGKVSSQQDKLLFACNNYEAAYEFLQNQMYNEERLLQDFQSIYTKTRDSINEIRKQSTDVRFGITERIVYGISSESSSMLRLMFLGCICVVLSIIWVIFSAWYLFYRPTHKMSELIRDFNITYRIPDPREVSLKELQVILANMRPILMEVRSIKQKNKYLKELNTKLGQISYLDGLTQLHNRRALEEVIKRRPDLSNHSAVFMLDIDHFKLFNDSEGHQAGDEALRMVARTIKANLTHSKDMVYRYGGEEFCVILTCIDYKSTIELADRIVTSVENLHLRNSGINGYATISLGISYYAGAYAGDMDASIVQHIRWADAALYIAKRQGRNQCRIYKARNDLFYENNPEEARFADSDHTVTKNNDWNEYHQQLAGDALATVHVTNPNGANDIADTMALYSAMANHETNEDESDASAVKDSSHDKQSVSTVSKNPLKELERQEASLLRANQRIQAERGLDHKTSASAIVRANVLSKARGLVEHANQVAHQVKHFAHDDDKQSKDMHSGLFDSDHVFTEPALATVEVGAVELSHKSQINPAGHSKGGISHSDRATSSATSHKEQPTEPKSKEGPKSGALSGANLGSNSDAASNLAVHTVATADSSAQNMASHEVKLDPVDPNANNELQLTPVAYNESLKSKSPAQEIYSSPAHSVAKGDVHHSSENKVDAKPNFSSRDKTNVKLAPSKTSANSASQAQLAKGNANAEAQANAVAHAIKGTLSSVSGKDVPDSMLAHPDVSSRLEVEPLSADHPISLLAEANKERLNQSMDERAHDQEALKQIQENLPKAYDEDSDDFYSEDYEEDLIIPHMDELDTEEHAFDADLPRQRQDADFISIYYGDTPVDIDSGAKTSKKSK